MNPGSWFDSITMVSFIAGSFISTAVCGSEYSAPSMMSAHSTTSATGSGLNPKRSFVTSAMNFVHER